MSIEHKYRTLVERLYEKTNSRSLQWSYNVDDDRVWTSIANRTLTIMKGENDDLEPLITVEITGLNNRRERFDDEALQGPSPNVRGFNSYYVLMDALRDGAIRQATGADEDVDAILNDLDDDLPF